ncbi:MAG TPA: M28 family peptidase, partial [Caldilineaceae bacterium]|nr:M28 family peptidase [Caldilineaceae bacterium]
MNRLRMYTIELALVLVLAAAVSYFGYLGYGLLTPSFVAEPFSGERALQFAARQLEFGERPTGDLATIRMSDWLTEELRMLGWDVVIQEFTTPQGEPARNIIAIRSPTQASARTALLMTHYDTRMYADRDPDPENHIQPAPGANAGASGTAVLLELARTLDVPATGHTICLVFLDAEENGGIEGWEDGLGSRYLVERLERDIPRCRVPRFALYLDLVGAANHRFYAESTSHPALTTAIWQVAAEQGAGAVFINEPTWSATDAHSLFQAAGIPAATIADYAYPHRDTLADTLDKLSAESLGRVGATLKAW